MFLEILIAILIGGLCGTITGLTPGVHVNLISIIIIGSSGFALKFVSPIILAVVIISMAITHTFLDSIPSTFLGCPDSGTVLNILPAHKLLKEGKGFEAVKLTTIGSLLSLIVVILLIPIAIPFLPKIYEFIQPLIAFILIGVIVFMILKQKTLKQKIWAFALFTISGGLGIAVLNLSVLKQPLFPLLSGLFGTSALILSLSENSAIPKQTTKETIHVGGKKTIKALSASVFSGSLTGLFPGLGSAQAAVLGQQLVGNIGNHAFLILLGGINTVNFLFSIATFYALQKARNGAIIAVMSVTDKIGTNELVVFLAVALVVGAIATILALFISKGFARLISKVNYKILIGSVIAFVTILVFVFSSWLGLLVLAISTTIGFIAPLKNIPRNMAMGCLLLPVILYFVL